MTIKLTNNTDRTAIADALLADDDIEIEVVSLKKMAEQFDWISGYVGPERNIEFFGAWDEGEYRVFMRLLPESDDD